MIKRRYKKSKFHKLLIIISLSLTFFISIGYSMLQQSLNISGSVHIDAAAILQATSETDTTAFRSDAYKEKIKTITFEDEINVPSNAKASWDIGEAQNGNVMAYVTVNADDSTYYDLYIQSNSQLYANKDMSYWFYNFQNVDSINGLELLDTTLTTNMRYMFYQTGYLSNALTLDLSNFDTKKVSDMRYMFYKTGYNNPTFTLDVSNFNTEKVTNMRYMFYNTGYNSTVFTLDVSNFNINKVINISYMFYQTGYSNPNFTLDVSNFDTSNATDMSYMFYQTGYLSTVLTLDVSNFDTSNVKNMSYMFFQTGHSNPNFILDVSNFDTSNVTDMSYMFYQTGGSSTKLNTSITIKNHNTTSYSWMFYGVATQTGSKITVNYTSETSELVDKMIATKSDISNVVKGYNVDNIISFTIDATTYNAYEGMTWLDWVNSNFNIDDKFTSSPGIYVYDISSGEYVRRTDGTGEELAETVIENGIVYTITPDGGISVEDE